MKHGAHTLQSDLAKLSYAGVCHQRCLATDFIRRGERAVAPRQSKTSRRQAGDMAGTDSGDLAFRNFGQYCLLEDTPGVRFWC